MCVCHLSQSIVSFLSASDAAAHNKPRADKYAVDSMGDLKEVSRRHSTRVRRLSMTEQDELRHVLMERVKPYFVSESWRLYSPKASDAEGVWL